LKPIASLRESRSFPRGGYGLLVLLSIPCDVTIFEEADNLLSYGDRGLGNVEIRL
jgi:hypothetical protein